MQFQISNIIENEIIFSEEKKAKNEITRELREKGWSDLAIENEVMKRKSIYSPLVRLLLKDLYLINYGDTWKKRKLKELIKSGNLSNVTIESLQQLYWITVSSLRSKYSRATISECVATPSEIAFTTNLKHYTRTKFYQSFWIGGNVVDLFFPQFSLAIELDGKIHNGEGKGRKDCYKEDFLADLGIAVSHIENPNALITSRNIGIKMKHFQRKGSRNQRRLMRNIYIITIAHHCPIDLVSDFYSYNFRKLVSEIYPNKYQLLFKKDNSHLEV